MSVTDNDGNVIDTETGEIIGQDTHARIGENTAIVPTQVTHSTEVAQLPTTIAELLATFDVDAPTPLEVAQWIMEPEQMEQADPEESTRAILARILTSPDAEAVLKTQDVTHAKDILNEAIEVLSVKWQRSDHQVSASCYAVMTCKSGNDGRDMIVTCGGRSVMGQLLRLDMIGGFPRRVRIVEKRKPTANGYHPLYLEAA